MPTKADSKPESTSGPTPTKSAVHQPALRASPSTAAKTPSSTQMSPEPTPSHTQQPAGLTSDKNFHRSPSNKPVSSDKPSAKPKPASSVRSPYASAKQKTGKSPASESASSAKPSAKPVNASKDPKEPPKKEGDEQEKTADSSKKTQPFYSTVNTTTAHVPPRHPSQKQKSKDPSIEPPVPNASPAPAQSGKPTSNTANSSGEKKAAPVAKKPVEKRETPSGKDGESKGQKRPAKESFPRPVVIGPDGQPVEDVKVTRSKTWNDKPAKRPKGKEKPASREAAPPKSGPQPGPHNIVPVSSNVSMRSTSGKPAAVDSVNEAGRYKEYNQVQDPMKNHEAFLGTHYARINKIHRNYGAVDCTCPKSFGKYRSKFEVIRRWNNINIDRQNYKFFEMLSTTKSHYDNVKCMASYEKMRHAMEHKVKNSKMIARNRRVRLGARLPHPSVTFGKDLIRKVRNGLNGPDMISQEKKLSSNVPSWRTIHGKGK